MWIYCGSRTSGRCQQLKVIVQRASCIEKSDHVKAAANRGQRTCYHTGNKKIAAGPDAQEINQTPVYTHDDERRDYNVV